MSFKLRHAALPSLLLLSTLLASVPLCGQAFTFRTLNTENVSDLLTTQSAKPFLLVIWSIDCPTCLKELQVISDLRLQRPDSTIIMLSIDPLSAEEQIQQYLEQFELNALAQWRINPKHAPKVLAVFDNAWRGEVPRSYVCFNKHPCLAKSGFLTEMEFKLLLDKLAR